jgi:hypothetical protein
LRGESFDEAVPSTHGIQVSSLPLAPQVFDAPVTLKIWDFGATPAARAALPGPVENRVRGQSANSRI